jgi:iron complex transport system permease protein
VTHLTLRMSLVGRNGLSMRLHRRSLLVAAAVVAAMLALAVGALTTGDFPVSVRDVLASLLGGGDAGTSFIVRTLRAPRVLTAALVGAAFGASGAVFQSLTGNPLGSPDVIGFTYGAATGGIVAILLISPEPGTVAPFAVAGGLLTAAAVYALSWRHGGVQPFRLVLVGLGIGYTMLSVNAYLVTRAEVADALQAQRWLLGSVNGADWATVRTLGLALTVLLPLLALLSRPLAAMELGDDASAALGVRVQRARTAVALVGVCLAAAGVAAAGPVAFVALAAPQIGRRLTGVTGPGVTVAALTGAALLVGADLTAQRLLPENLPVGLVTGFVGGGYLVSLLLRSGRVS